MTTTYLELFRNSSGIQVVNWGDSLLAARGSVMVSQDSTTIDELAILQIDVDENNKVTVTEVPAEEPREYWGQRDGLESVWMLPKGRDHVKQDDRWMKPQNVTIYVRNEAGGLDVVDGQERVDVIARFFK